MLSDSLLYLENLKLDHRYLLPISLPELFVTSHGGTMTMSLMHQWHDTICGGVIGPRRSLLYGAYGCILEEESLPVYDTDIEDVIEEEEGFVGKRGLDGEEDNIKDFVVVANDLCSSMIQTTLNVDFEEYINTKSHELMSFGKSIIVKVSQSSRSSQDKKREFDAGDTNLDDTSSRDE
ncbi:hypothetical protein Tco_0782274 [Tanacetum coccineum]